MFLIKDDSGDNLASFSSSGGLTLKASLEENANHIASELSSFKIRTNGEDVFIVENNGTIYIDGNVLEDQDPLTSDDNSYDFRIKNNESELVAYINESGYLFLKGDLIENGDP